VPTMNDKKKKQEQKEKNPLTNRIKCGRIGINMNDNDKFFLNMQMESFKKRGWLSLSNPAIVLEYADEIKRRGWQCVVIDGFNSPHTHSPIVTYIVTPGLEEKYKALLVKQINEMQEYISEKKQCLLEKNILRI